MLERTFCHVPGIGLKTERRLWSEGYLSWRDFLLGVESGHLPAPCRRSDLQGWVAESKRRLQKGQAGYFASLLPQEEMWRLFGAFRHSTAYVDIETTGLGRGMDHITSIALYDGDKVATYVFDRNLEQFEDDIRLYQVIVTFNGSRFDLPFLRQQLRLSLPPVHIDLRQMLKSLGFTGGLKRCEEEFGLERQDLGGVDGYAAVLLWRTFQEHKEEDVLETLLAYNVQDVLSLESLLYKAYNLKLERMGWQDRCGLRVPPLAANPYLPSRRVLSDLGYVGNRAL